MNPDKAQGHGETKSAFLERLQREYGAGDPKQREAVKKLGKDEFFKLMINQIQHQDPLKPAQNEQMAAQMAQFSALEQMVNVNQNLEKLTMAQQPLQNMGAANLIGKYVTADSARLLHNEGKYSDVHFDLPANAERVHVTIINDKGENVKEIERFALPQGPVKIEWDGRKSNNMLAPTGQYMVQISAVDERGKSLQIKTTSTQVVHGVGFEGKETVLLTGDLTKPTKLLLRNVTKIVDATAGGGGAPQGMITAPNGMQIGGLEKIIENQDRPVEGAIPGENSKFTPVNLPAMNKLMEKPVVDQGPSSDELRRRAMESPDLSAANLAADAVKAGKMLPTGGPKPVIDEVNPAAAAMGYSAAQGQAMPSSKDGSTAGKWNE